MYAIRSYYGMIVFMIRIGKCRPERGHEYGKKHGSHIVQTVGNVVGRNLLGSEQLGYNNGGRLKQNNGRDLNDKKFHPHTPQLAGMFKIDIPYTRGQMFVFNEEKQGSNDKYNNEGKTKHYIV